MGALQLRCQKPGPAGCLRRKREGRSSLTVSMYEAQLQRGIMASRHLLTLWQKDPRARGWDG